MCGLLGYYNNGILDKKKRKGIRKSFAALSARGTHASGISGAKENHLWTYKKDVASTALVTHKDYQEIIADTYCGILHSRYTTQGSEKIHENNHPFEIELHDGSFVSMAHNGIISNYNNLKTRFKLETTIATDSYIILHLLNKFYVKYNNIETAIAHATRWIDGSFALLFIHVTKTEPTMYFLKHKNPLTVIDTMGCKILCSTPEILKKGFNYTHEFAIKEDMLYKTNGQTVSLCGELKIYKPVTPKYTPMDFPYAYNYNYTKSYTQTWENNAWATKIKCVHCNTLQTSTMYSIVHQKYLCEDCDKLLDQIAEKTCDVCSNLNAKYRQTIDMTLCDDCITLALGEGKDEPIEQYCLD